MTDQFSWNAWILECGCDPDIVHCDQCDQRRAVRAKCEASQAFHAEVDLDKLILKYGGDFVLAEVSDHVAVRKAIPFGSEHGLGRPLDDVLRDINARLGTKL